MKRIVCFLLVVAAALLAMPVFAQEYTNRREVMQDEALRQDFNLQGEYHIIVAGEKVAGLHLIADGGGKFRFVVYIGGLPGDGWRAGDARLLGTAKVEGEELLFTVTEQSGTQDLPIPDKIEAKGKITIEQPQRPEGGQGAGQGGGQGAARRAFRGPSVKIEIGGKGDIPGLFIEKQYRTSPTLGEQPPEGAVVIFDGTNLDNFMPGAKMNEMPQTGQGQRPAGRGNTLWAEAASKPFENKPYKMHIEFMLSYMPQAKGQARSNSGVYIGEMYECQVLDSFGLEGKDNECGGFYQASKPKVNMCFPPLTWQTYDIDYTPPKFEDGKKTANAKISVKHNGVVIHDNLEMAKETPGRKKEADEPRGVYLQGHGNKVQYRNIWIQYK
ncbi:MAG: DUF1080 domain-containing protein [Planctomycetaceae bacterium]|nr:DUF1080 domain-containing protein [Planctomycetaceae bacterium]